MSNPENIVGTQRPLEQLVETAGAIGFGVFRLGVAVGTAPLALLPPQPRAEAMQATNDLVAAVGTFQSGLTRAVIDSLNTWARR